MKEKRLKDLIINEELVEAPCKTGRFGRHYEFTTAIGKDETASVVMSEEAHTKLRQLTEEY